MPPSTTAVSRAMARVGDREPPAQGSWTRCRRMPLTSPAGSRARDGEQDLRVAGLVLDLLAQSADVHVDRLLVVELGVVPPDVLDELGATEHLTGVPGEEHQQAELDRRQVDLPVAALTAPRVRSMTRSAT